MLHSAPRTIPASKTDLSFHSKTPEPVKQILRQYLGKDVRLRFFFGDAETGADWLCAWDTQGYVNSSCGTQKIPLLVPLRSSSGGGALLDHCIIKIQVGKCVLYRHPSYNLPELQVFPLAREHDGRDMWTRGLTHGVFTLNQETSSWDMHSGHKSEKNAVNFRKFLLGERLLTH